MRLKYTAITRICAVTVIATVIGTTFAPQTTLAAPVPASKAVYHQFQTYRTEAAKSTESLVKARKYLMNHIDKVGPWQATLMTLQLENMQNVKLADMDQKMYTEHFQQALSHAHEKIEYEQNLTYSNLLKEIKDPAVRKLLQEASDLGFKLETSEGIYYPIINYEIYKKFKPFVQADIASYIDIMAAESNQMTTSDAGIVIPWSELIQRTLDKEAFLNKFPNSNRTTMVKHLLFVEYVFYGSDNTPAYDWYTDDETRTLVPDVKQAYEKALSKREPDTKSLILDTLEQLLQVLNQNKNELTPEIRKIIEPVQQHYAVE
ncbi:hypothetical protein C0Q44_19800 [Paenibacillus sp. PCH8]|uniref:hypothetical protein n=1 Tax=Paenibacillus sp. PCH8 TaxID=2066524 RepID=UPI000CF94A5A|nr:hypothetical protein [Paenibacillus sp. PCH8]PQP81913.1 hypothetical protein C0Q44_19800 [Paenibacillus sp. PCH8]